MANEIQLMAFEMEPSRLDDQMELGTSPIRPVDDIDFEDLDPVNDPSVDNSMLDEVELSARDNDAMQADNEDMYRYDEMFDNQDKNNIESATITEFTMDDKPNFEDVEEEILYDEDTAEEYENAGAEPILLENVEQEENLMSASLREADDNHGTSADTTQGYHDTDFAEDTTNISGQNGIVPETVVADLNDGAKEQLHKEEGKVYQTDQIAETSVVDFAHVADAQQFPGNHRVASMETEHGEGLESTLEEEFDEALDEEAVDSASQPDETNAVGSGQNVVQGGEVQSKLPPDNLGSATDFEMQRELRSIKMTYLGEEMSLFPPTEADPAMTFFLSDPDLAQETFEKLLLSCREILGDSLGHEDELVLDIPTLGLHIAEDSKYASSLTLFQVVEVYRQLCQNEQDVASEPLYCSLSSRVCFATQFEYLNGAAQEGKSFSEIAADYVDSPGPSEDFYDVSQVRQADEEHSRAAIPIPGGEVRELKDQDFPEPVERHTSSPIPPRSPLPQSEQNYKLLETDEHAEAIGGYPEQSGEQTVVKGQSNDEEVENEAEQRQSSQEPQENTFVNDEVNLEITSGEIGLEFQTDHQLDAETSSSHTLQADQADVGRYNSSEGGQRELNDIESTKQVEYSADDDHEHSSTADLDDHAQDETHADFNEQSLTGETEEDDGVETDAFLEAPEDDPLFPTDTENGQATTRGLRAHSGQDLGLELSGLEEDDNTPTTPSKQSSSKRKAIEEEEELDYLDLSTPEPKRSRPS